MGAKETIMQTTINLNETFDYDTATIAVNAIGANKVLIITSHTNENKTELFVSYETNFLLPHINPAISLQLYVNDEPIANSRTICWDDVSEPINTLLYETQYNHPELEADLQPLIDFQSMMWEMIYQDDECMA